MRSFSTLKTAEQYCADKLRQHDYHSYLSSLFIPSAHRNCVAAIRALNIETALVRENVSDSSLGKMKLAWWNNGIDQMYAGNPPNHPVLTVLSEYKSHLSKAWLKRIIQEREKNMQDPQYLSIADLEQYAENTASVLMYLELQAMGVSDVNADHTASHIGKAVGITTILRATPFHIRDRRLYLPTDILMKHSLSSESIFRHGPSKELEEVVFEIATKANDHLITARSFFDKIPMESFPVMLSAVSFLIILHTS